MTPTRQMMDTTRQTMDVDEAVTGRYSAAAHQAEASLCCPVSYEKKYLEVLPDELIERDYGCGDPSRYVERGETVLDLGSGGGKICYIASQVVGPEGHVIGVDQNDSMLQLARRFQSQIGDAIGWHNTIFHKGRIQDLALDLDQFESYLAENPVHSSDDWMRAQTWSDQQRTTNPMIADSSVDVVVSNCVLNLVSPQARQQLFAELFRVLKRGGRAVISDIVSDELVPEHLQNDPQLWSGCISGAFVEDKFLSAFEQAGFYGTEIIARQQQPWATIEGIEFRSMTVRAYKGKEGSCLDHHQAVIYNGPWKSVTDDDGHLLRRGERMSVCEKIYQIYTQQPYSGQITGIPPHEAVPPSEAQPYDCRDGKVRDPQQTKGKSVSLTTLPDGNCCGPDEGCC